MSVPKYDELTKPLLVMVNDGQTYKMKDITNLANVCQGGPEVKSTFTMKGRLQ